MQLPPSPPPLDRLIDGRLHDMQVLLTATYLPPPPPAFNLFVLLLLDPQQRLKTHTCHNICVCVCEARRALLQEGRTRSQQRIVMWVRCLPAWPGAGAGGMQHRAPWARARGTCPLKREMQPHEDATPTCSRLSPLSLPLSFVMCYR